MQTVWTVVLVDENSTTNSYGESISSEELLYIATSEEKAREMGALYSKRYPVVDDDEWYLEYHEEELYT